MGNSPSKPSSPRRPEEEPVPAEVGAGDAPPADADASSDEAAAEENLESHDENVGNGPYSLLESDPANSPGEIDESPNAELSSDNSTNAEDEGTVTLCSPVDTSSEVDNDEPDSNNVADGSESSAGQSSSANTTNEEQEGERGIENSSPFNPTNAEPENPELGNAEIQIGPDESPEQEAEPEPEAAHVSSTRGKKRRKAPKPDGSDAKRKKRDGGGDQDGQAPA